MNKETNYFVSYTYEKGTGCTTISSKEKIKTFNDINKIKNKIEESFGIKKVTIMNFIKL